MNASKQILNYGFSFLLFISIFFVSCKDESILTVPSTSDLVSIELASSWDEGMPIGNGTIGALIWKKGDRLRFSLDRTDLWDLRPMDSISGPNNRFSWVKQQVEMEDYLPVQKKYDHPYDASPAPSKIPGAALEFSLDKLGLPSNVHLYLNDALCQVSWDNGTRLQTFVSANEPVGWFVFRNLSDTIDIDIIAPKYAADQEELEDLGPVTGLDLRRLGYSQGQVLKGNNIITYHQKGWGDYYYDVAVSWERSGDMLYGVWSITSSLVSEKASELVAEAISNGPGAAYKAHKSYWDKYWAMSSINIPDEILQKQYDNEMYKFGSASREHSYPISLQAVWTADNGKLPPWKGDYHHDLNTELSYWPAYTGNRLSEGMGFLNTLWNQRDTYREYTQNYFQVEGLNVPGVCTLQGVPMGGWIQYSMSPTVGAWLSHHFYLHWKYSGDKEFLETRAYPFLSEVATFLKNISFVDTDGFRKLPLSSSPEIFDNSIRAWFKEMTNFDLSLMHFVFNAASELAQELGQTAESKQWLALADELQDLDVDQDNALTFAKGFPYNGSHRHLSHAMAIHPLGLLDWSRGDQDQKVIQATLDKIESYGPDYWTGYTYSWFALMQARALNGDKATQYLRDFANHFCLSNTFHVNGDQTNSGKSQFTYRPFTLEGNFAFASGVQEMLLQSHAGYIAVFPAISSSWKEASFTNLRAIGAFLVSAKLEQGKVSEVKIISEKGNAIRLKSPFSTSKVSVNGHELTVGSTGFIEINTQEGEVINIKPL